MKPTGLSKREHWHACRAQVDTDQVACRMGKIGHEITMQRIRRIVEDEQDNIGEERLSGEARTGELGQERIIL